MPRKTKSQNLNAHAKRRLKERFALHVQDSDLTYMAKLCMKGEYVCFLEAQSLTHSKAILCFRDTYVPVIYHKKYHQIVTVLTMDMLNARELDIFADALKISRDELCQKFQLSQA